MAGDFFHLTGIHVVAKEMQADKSLPCLWMMCQNLAKLIFTFPQGFLEPFNLVRRRKKAGRTCQPFHDIIDDESVFSSAALQA